MFKTIINAWKVKDIRTKMLYTLLLIVVYRLGSFIPVSSVNGEKLGELIASYDFLSFLNLFSGGSLNNFSLFAMGISPYITASNDDHYAGINKIGLARRGFTPERIAAIHEACRILFQSGLNYMDACDRGEAELPASPERDYLLEFIRSSKRGCIKQYASVTD